MFRRSFFAAAAACVLVLALTGCSSTGKWFEQNINFNGARPLVVKDDAIQQVDLFRELIPERAGDASLVPLNANDVQGAAGSSGASTIANVPSLKAANNYAPQNGIECLYYQGSNISDDVARICIDFAYKAFEAYQLDKQVRRNRIFAKLVLASDQACSQFEQHLNTTQAEANFAAGVTTTALAGAGAIVNSVPAARVLAGLAGIASGTRAEFNSDFFYQHAAGIVVKAIDGKREELRGQFATHMALDYDAYPVAMAVSEAIRYNHVCSLVEGLNLADTQLTLAQNPGLDMLIQTLPKANLAQKIASQRLTPSQVSAADLAGVGFGASTITSSTTSLSSAVGAYSQAVQGITREYAAATAALDTLNKALTSSKSNAQAATQTLLTNITGNTSTKDPGSLSKFRTTAVTALTACSKPAIDIDNAVATATVTAAGDSGVASQSSLSDQEFKAKSLSASITSYGAAVVSVLKQVETQSSIIAGATTSAMDPALSKMLTNLNATLQNAPPQPSCPSS